MQLHQSIKKPLIFQVKRIHHLVVRKINEINHEQEVSLSGDLKNEKMQYQQEDIAKGLEGLINDKRKERSDMRKNKK